MTLIKVCGMRSAQNIREVENTGVDWMGFIFHRQSPRFVAQLPDYLPQKAKCVGVFVNETIGNVLETAARFGLDFVQLHGDESPEYCDEMGQNGVKIIKAFSIGDEFPAEEVSTYNGVCQYFLFDTKTPAHGGSGKKFNWDVLADYRGETPFLLSGGIAPEDAAAVQNFSHPQFFGIDINSKFEISPALKDAEEIGRFVELFRHLD